MKITGVKTIFADAGRRVYVFVKVETDQPGLVGWGEASLEGKPRAVAGCVADMEPMIIGEDPRRIEYIWQILYRGAFWRQGVIGMSAISGIDQALWDIKGKDLGKPVYELLGGVQGCTHITEMLAGLPTAALQTFAGEAREDSGDGAKPFQLDQCIALETGSETVRRWYPKWHRKIHREEAKKS